MAKLSIYEQLCFSTTRIETVDASGNLCSGTGFFFNLKFEDNIVPLLITNKHVVSKAKQGMFKFTIADYEGNPKHKEHYTISYSDNFENMWVMHPQADVDLCALPILAIINDAKRKGVRLFYRTLETIMPTQEQLANVDNAEEIVMIGYPNGLWDSVNNMPIIRRGITATDVNLDYNGKKEFLIDAACFPGSSGSPIINCNDGSYRDRQGNFNIGPSRFLFLGILYAGPLLTVAGDIQIVTVPNLQQKPMSISQIPINLGIIIKSERINDFIPIFSAIISKQQNI